MDATRGDKVEKLGIEGIGTVTEPKRTYPQGFLASQVLGLVGTDNTGLSGLEYSQDESLSGEDGERRLVKDALGEPISMIETKRSEPGDDLALTLDARIQERTEAVLADVGQTYTPRRRHGGRDGPAHGRDARARELAARGRQQRGRRARLRAPEPLDPGQLRAGLDLQGFHRLRRARGEARGARHDAGRCRRRSRWPTGPSARRTTAAAAPRRCAQILAESSNVGSVMIGLKLGAKKFDKWVRRFGFGRPTGVDLPGEEGGIVLRPEHYSGSSMGNMPIGQGIAVTPMQMATAYTAIANHGVMRRPYIVQGEAPPPKRVLSRRTAEQVSHMLEGVLAAGGTAEEAQVEGYTLAGKTGTAEKAIKGGYSKTDFIASFIGFAPGEEPAPAGGGDGRHAARRHLRRHRGSARLRAHHGVRAAVPEDPARLGRRSPARLRRAGGAPRASAPAPCAAAPRRARRRRRRPGPPPAGPPRARCASASARAPGRTRGAQARRPTAWRAACPAPGPRGVRGRARSGSRPARCAAPRPECRRGRAPSA